MLNRLTVKQNKPIVWLLLLSCFLWHTAWAQPSVTIGAPANQVTNIIQARWRGLSNTGGVNSALYLGNSNIGVAANRVEVGGNVYNKPGNNTLTFIYDRANDRLLASVNATISAARTLTYTALSTKLLGVANLCRMNFMSILIRNTGVVTGSVTLSNVILNGNALGSFSIAPNINQTWTIGNFDFSPGFTLTATFSLDAGTYTTAEASKIEITVGERRPISSISTTTICPGSVLPVNLSGLFPNQTYTLNYTFDGNTFAPVVTTNSLGNTSFSTAPVTNPQIGQTLSISSLTPSALTACSWNAVVNNTVLAQDDPICAIILPVQLNYFEGTTLNGYDDLRWQLTNTEDVAHLQLEYCADALNWQTLLPSQKNNTLTSFKHVGIAQLVPLRYYRLKLNLQNGQVKYSKLLVLKNEFDLSAVQLYPNPFTENLTVQQANTAGLEITVYGSDGRLLHAYSTRELTFTIETQLWPKGIYLVKLSSNTGQTTYQKCVK